MKYIKQYEDTTEEESNQPQLGDYVYCETDPKAGYKPANFIGILIRLQKRKDWPYRVKYPLTNNPDNADIIVGKDELIDFSKSLKDLEHYTDANKFNL